MYICVVVGCLAATILSDDGADNDMLSTLTTKVCPSIHTLLEKHCMMQHTAACIAVS